MRNIIILLLVILAISCNLNSKTSEQANILADTPAEMYALDSIKFFTPEKYFSEMIDSFHKPHVNPLWSYDNLNEHAYTFNGFGFDNLIGVFSKKEGSLIGVALCGTDYSKHDSEFFENFQKLEAYLTKEFGQSTDKHSNLTMRNIEMKGEMPVNLWQQGKKSYLTTISFDGKHYSVNLFVYRNDQLKPDTTIRALDGELVALRKLM